jgi:hypothetical protein
MSRKEEIFEELKGKVVQEVYLSACLDLLKLVFTDGSIMSIDAHIPRYETLAELDIELTTKESE